MSALRGTRRNAGVRKNLPRHTVFLRCQRTGTCVPQLLINTVISPTQGKIMNLLTSAGKRGRCLQAFRISRRKDCSLEEVKASRKFGHAVARTLIVSALLFLHAALTAAST